MDRKFQLSLQQITRLRQELAALDEKSMQSPPAEQAQFSQRIVDICLEIEVIESRIRVENQRKAVLINDLRQKIVGSLEQFNQWQKAMREMEKLFLVNFVRPGFILKQAVRQREYLASALIRLRTRIINHEFQSLSDLDNAIQNVLSHSEHGFVADQRSFEDEEVQPESFWKMVQELDPQQLVESVNEDQIERDFRKIVLPAVHPDTSDTPVDIFLTVKTVYEQSDYLLMEAYVAKYRGETILEEAADLRETREMLEEQEHQYHSLAERLDRRLNALKKELTAAELEDSEKVKELLHEQRDEIKKLIQAETEKIFDLRSQIMDLVQLYQELSKGENDA
ncbi:MAG: hypothetical protein H0S79_21040 [Anaerolineaceae bacterium]|nr:hypothetical protein [Anaerolineaceae bacterium]